MPDPLRQHRGVTNLVRGKRAWQLTKRRSNQTCRCLLRRVDGGEQHVRAWLRDMCRMGHLCFARELTVLNSRASLGLVLKLHALADRVASIIIVVNLAAVTHFQSSALRLARTPREYVLANRPVPHKWHNWKSQGPRGWTFFQWKRGEEGAGTVLLQSYVGHAGSIFRVEVSPT